jgi:multicomponent Na+:H+ antiporter subunit D
MWPLFMAVLLMALWRHGALQRWVAVAGSTVHVGLAAALLARADGFGPQAVAVGSWPPPFAIVFVADRFGAAMALIAAVIGLMISIYAVSGIDARREAFGYHPLAQGLIAGVCGAFLTGDFFNLYVWFEVMLMASFVLLALGGERRQMAGALHYVSLNLIASTTFLAALGLMYGLTGTLNMADVAQRLPESGQPGMAGAVCALLALSFGVKAAVFPVYAWLPASYHTPPAVVTALFAGLLTKVGVYALVRATTLVFATSAPFLIPALFVIALATMVFGVIGAVAMGGFRRVLAVHIVSQIGYMVLGLALMSPLALAGSVFYILHNILVKTNLFLIAGIARRKCHTEELAGMGGLYARYPGLALLFLVSALSLSGVPPLSGFWAKLAIVRASLDAREWIAAGVALAVGLLTLFSMLKLWNEAFWKPRPGGDPVSVEPELGRKRFRYLPVVLLAGCTVAFGLFAGPVLAFAARAAGELLSPGGYIEASLGASP